MKKTETVWFLDDAEKPHYFFLFWKESGTYFWGEWNGFERVPTNVVWWIQ